VIVKPVVIELRVTDKFSYEYRLLVQRKNEGAQVLAGDESIHPRKIKELEDRGFDVKIRLPKAWFNK